MPHNLRQVRTIPPLISNSLALFPPHYRLSFSTVVWFQDFFLQILPIYKITHNVAHRWGYGYIFSPSPILYIRFFLLVYLPRLFTFSISFRFLVFHSHDPYSKRHMYVNLYVGEENIYSKGKGKDNNRPILVLMSPKCYTIES